MSIDNPTPSGEDHGLTPSQLQARASDDFGKATEQAKHDLDAVKERAAEGVRDLGHQASEKVGEVTDKAKSFAGEQKDMAAGQINGVAAAITKVADELEGSDQATIARYARDLASGLTNFGNTVQDRNVDDLMGMAQDFGRKQPVAFLGAAALAGFVASRFALASAQRRETKAPITPDYTSNQASNYSTSNQATNYSSETSAAYGTGTVGSNRFGDE
jgi:hypothetical protein